MIQRSHTAVIERNRLWQGGFETEPYEAGWAREAIFFVRTLEASGSGADMVARVQISPDGIHWCDEGTEMPVSTTPGVTFGRVRRFGEFLRLVGTLPDGVALKVIVYLSLKE